MTVSETTRANREHRKEDDMLDRFTWFKQSAYLWRGDNLNVYIDPWGVTDPQPADVVFITHAHFDHFNVDDLKKVVKRETIVVAPRNVAQELTGTIQPVAPGDSLEVAGIKVRAVPAYNVVESRLEAHPKANNWVGYVLELGDSTYYHAGDTDHAPELDDVKADVAFLPIGGTFTMTAREAGQLAKVIQPQLAVPMHYGYVVGSPKDAETFRAEADPVKVEVLTPENPFEQA
jgi:L-ascorbate metabolism protein UlaG (beta-lactamase superfamily)